LAAHHHEGQAALAAAIGAEQRVDLTLLHLEIQMVEHPCLAEDQADVGKLQKRIHEFGSPAPRDCRQHPSARIPASSCRPVQPPSETSL
jgi:hypothetical protein